MVRGGENKVEPSSSFTRVTCSMGVSSTEGFVCSKVCETRVHWCFSYIMS